MNPLIACCGLDCEACDARIATITNDNAPVSYTHLTLPTNSRV